MSDTAPLQLMRARTVEDAVAPSKFDRRRSTTDGYITATLAISSIPVILACSCVVRWIRGLETTSHFGMGSVHHVALFS